MVINFAVVNNKGFSIIGVSLFPKRQNTRFKFTLVQQSNLEKVEIYNSARNLSYKTKRKDKSMNKIWMLRKNNLNFNSGQVYKEHQI